MALGNQYGFNLDKKVLGFFDESLKQNNTSSIISRYSNLGSSNPFKGPTPKSLFYEAAKRKPGKYGQYLFYSFGNFSNDFMEDYYLSEREDKNSNVSSINSRNPTAGFLVSETANLERALKSNISSDQSINSIFSTGSNASSIIGGIQAPYYWKDFLYCKYYGAIPNNYMITLRRYPHPVLDNMSIPEAIKNSSSFSEEGAGRPVAQAVTWYGGNTGNSLASLLSFSSGINWTSKDQESERTQEAFSKGLFQSGPLKNLGEAADALGVSDSTGADIFKNARIFAEASILAMDPNETSRNAILAKSMRDKAKEGEGLLGEYKWVSVDVIRKAWFRDVGLEFAWNDFTVTFEYDLTSVGEVNTKAAMLDIMGNLLSIGTNYGNFLTPDVRYNANFPAMGFPGGNAGLQEYYQNPVNWFVKYAKEISGVANPGSDESIGTGESKIESFFNEFSTVLKSGGDPQSVSKFIESGSASFGSGFNRLLKLAITKSFIESYQSPISFLTGAPVGEWHLTIGNPCNPIAMIGNLICKNVSLSLSENLGPDDFPTSLKAVFTLGHARDRERGEIESIFNRGDGRLYQSSLSTSASLQSLDSFSDTEGNFLSNSSDVFNLLNGNAYKNELFPDLRGD